MRWYSNQHFPALSIFATPDFCAHLAWKRFQAAPDQHMHPSALWQALAQPPATNSTYGFRKPRSGSKKTRLNIIKHTINTEYIPSITEICFYWFLLWFHFSSFDSKHIIKRTRYPLEALLSKHHHQMPWQRAKQLKDHWSRFLMFSRAGNHKHFSEDLTLKEHAQTMTFNKKPGASRAQELKIQRYRKVNSL